MIIRTIKQRNISVIFSLLLIFYSLIVTGQEKQIDRLFPCSKYMERPYGITAHVSRVGWDWELRNDEMKAAKKIGINFIRTDLDFPTLVQSGEFKPQIIDSMIYSARRYGITILPILSFPSNYDENQYYHVYLTYAVKRYKKDFPFIEAVNEPNCIKKYSANQYGMDLENIYNVATKYGASKILLGGLIGINKFFDTLSVQHTYKHFDIMNFHYYGQPEGVLFELQRIKNGMAQNGWSKPVWLTETGCTTVDNAYNYKFYKSVLPLALSKLHIDASRSTIGIVEDYKLMLRDMPEDLLSCLGYFKEVKFLNVSELEKISPKEIPVLIPSFSEYFPTAYRNALYQYVKHGGTIVSNYGLPFYYGRRTETSITNDWSLYNKLHLSFECWWNNSKAPQYPEWIMSAHGWDDIPVWKFEGKTSARFLTTDGLKGKDRFISIIKAGNKKYSGTVCGIYQLDSELKGNIIVSTWIGKYSYSERDQAMRIPRIFLLSFASGVDKVFWYNLRAKETSDSDPESYFGILHRDLTPKYSYNAYHVLVQMCPDGSSRPIITQNESNGVFHAVWKRPDGKHVSAFWVNGGIINNYLLNNNKCYDVLGHKIVSKKIDIGPSVVYVFDD